MQEVVKLVTASMPFAPVSWWQRAAKAGNVIVDLAEFYQKMSLRNRYYLAAPGGKQLLSVPIAGGRNQRIATGHVSISYDTDWQKNHWRTIVSLYGRSPYFEFYAPYLEPLFQEKHERLHDWNQKGMAIVVKLLHLPVHFVASNDYVAHYGPEVLDLRMLKPSADQEARSRYRQVFEDRIGFLPDCSILDLLFCEGPDARTFLV
ncbi:MAG: WbqC family protein [Edaphocola sp.]